MRKQHVQRSCGSKVVYLLRKLKDITICEFTIIFFLKSRKEMFEDEVGEIGQGPWRSCEEFDF